MLENLHVTDLDPWNRLTCGLCYSTEFVSIEGSRVHCKKCNARIEIRPTCGESGYCADIYTDRCYEEYKRIANDVLPAGYAYLIDKKYSYYSGWIYFQNGLQETEHVLDIREFILRGREYAFDVNALSSGSFLLVKSKDCEFNVTGKIITSSPLEFSMSYFIGEEEKEFKVSVDEAASGLYEIQLIRPKVTDGYYQCERCKMVHTATEWNKSAAKDFTGHEDKFCELVTLGAKGFESHEFNCPSCNRTSLGSELKCLRVAV